MVLDGDDIYLLTIALKQAVDKNTLYDHNSYPRAKSLLEKLANLKWITLPMEMKRQKVETTDQIRSSHYGGPENPYEAIKVIDAWKAGFNLGNAIKYICRVSLKYISFSDHKEYKEVHSKLIEDLKKAKTYLEFEIEKLEKNK